jgi:hypothetical protein
MTSVLSEVEHDSLQLRAHDVMTDEVAGLPAPPGRRKGKIGASIVALKAGKVTGLVDLMRHASTLRSRRVVRKNSDRTHDAIS